VQAPCTKGLSRATYYRWEKELRQKGLSGSKPERKRPKRLRRKVLWRPELLSRIVRLFADALLSPNVVRGAE